MSKWGQALTSLDKLDKSRLVRLLVLILAGLAASAAAEEAKPLGLGMALGDPTGATAKYFFTENSAMDLGLGVSGTLVFWGDYSLHAWNLLPQPKRGKLGAYLSLGLRLEDEDPSDFGFRSMLGVSYWPHFKRHSIELFLELGPVLRVKPVPTRVRPDGSFGARWYFGKKK